MLQRFGGKLILMLVSAVICVSFCAQISPALCFEPTAITIVPNPATIICPPGGVSIVSVGLTGIVTLGDQATKAFEVRLIDQDYGTEDDIMGRVTVTPATDGMGPFVMGQNRQFILQFELRCENGYIVGIENSGEWEVELALEIDDGGYSNSDNHYDTTVNKYVLVDCQEPYAFVGGTSYGGYENHDHSLIPQVGLASTLLIAATAITLCVKRAKSKETTNR